LLQLCAATAQAKDFRIERAWRFGARAQDLLPVIIGYDKSCDRGCLYRAPHVAQSIVLAQERRPDSFYVWMAVKDVQDSSWFSRVTIRRDARGIHVEVRAVSENVAKSLAKLSGKRSDPDFDDAVATYDVIETVNNGRFLETRVNFSNVLRISGLPAVFGAGVIRDRLREEAQAVFLDLTAATRVTTKPPQASAKSGAAPSGSK
jgi:hypothetical protein